MEFYPFSLTHVEIILSEYVFQAFMVDIDLKGLPIQVMTTSFQRVDNRDKL